MGIVEAVGLALTLVLCSIGPGLIVLPWLRIDDDERLVVVVGVSLLAVFLAEFTLSVFDLPGVCRWAITTGCVACIAWRRHTLLLLLAQPVVRMQLAGLLLVLGHALLLLAAIRSYSGIYWAGDWYEHFERTMFFIERPDPRAARFLVPLLGADSGYTLTARPPFMNVLTAHAIALGGPSFAAFQVASTWFNTLACLPALALAGRSAALLGRRPESGTLAAAAALTLLPAFAQNATFGWTKLLAAFFVMAAVLLLARRDAVGSRFRLALAGGMVGAGVAVHYSAAVYAVVLGLAIVVAAVWRETPHGRGSVGDRIARACVAAAACGLPQLAVLLHWLGFAVATFGLRGTLASNTAVTDAAGMTVAENLWKIACNCGDTLVPHFLRERPPLIAELMTQPNRSAALRDWWFAPLQVNFPMTLGTVTQCAAAVAAMRLATAAMTLRGGRRAGAAWAWFFATGFLLGVAVVGARDTIGLAHICLQPLILIGAAATAASLPRLSWPVRIGMMIGLAWDYLVGVMLHFWLEQLPLKVFEVAQPDGTLAIGNTFGIGGAASSSVYLKQLGHLTFLGDQWPESCAACCFGAWLIGLVAWAILAATAFRPVATGLQLGSRDGSASCRPSLGRHPSAGSDPGLRP